MKKLFAIAAIMALGFTNVFAQVNPFKLLGHILLLNVGKEIISYS